MASVPLEESITIFNPAVKEFCQDIFPDDEYKCYSLYICHERSKNNNPETSSSISPYLNFLPTNYEAFPLVYKEKYKKLIKNTLLWDRVIIWEKRLKKEYDLIISRSKSLVPFSLEEYTKCKYVIFSRLFSFKKDGKTHYTLVPLLDLFNAHQKPNLVWYYSEKDNAMKADAKKNIKKGEELNITYGKQNNVSYLFFYGFTMKNNKKRMTYDLYWDEKYINFPNPPELKNVTKYYRKDLSENVGNIDDEITALEAMLAHFNDWVNDYPTKLEDDKKNIKSKKTKKDYILLCIYRVLIEEKEVYISFNLIISI